MMAPELVPGVTVLGNLAIDVINGAPPSPGGCASFAGVALEAGYDTNGMMLGAQTLVQAGPDCTGT